MLVISQRLFKPLRWLVERVCVQRAYAERKKELAKEEHLLKEGKFKELSYFVELKLEERKRVSWRPSGTESFLKMVSVVC
jgi:phosphomannomutase